METITAKIVNTAFAGDPENIVLQDIETNQIFEFSKIVNENINDGDISHPTIQLILSKEGHTIQISYNENNEVTLYL